MYNGQLLMGLGEVNDFNLKEMSEDDLNRNRSKGIIPRFFAQMVKCTDGTFIRKEYLELLVPGDAKSSPVHLVDDRLKQLYSRHYEAFIKGTELPTDGTPIEVMLGAEDPRTYMLKSMHLRTIEQLAGISDQIVKTIGMGGDELRLRAKKFMEVQKIGVDADEAAAKDAKIKELEDRLKSLEMGKASDDDEEEDEEDSSLRQTLHAAAAEPERKKKPKKKGKK